MQARHMIRAARPGLRQFERGSAFRQSAHPPEPLVTARLRKLSVMARDNRRGLTVMFSGPSGTGETMAAALARTLGKELFRIDLSDVAEKYIGETEKNLAQAFAIAQKRNAVLFFDECDALFAKRTDIKDIHDRYANQEVSYLLAQMERHRGVVILSTNNRSAIDPAVLRRVDTIVSLPPSQK
jgi:SpoVK/Ycf46/Vps4 family AAA+-type ATPase